MKQLQQIIERALRGPGPSRLLHRFGVDARRFWLLMDLFGQLHDRREILNQLGRDGPTLKVITAIYFVIAALVSLVMLARHAPLAALFSTFLGFTAFLLFTILLSEAGNSLLNPAEGLILAHQPINGATFTAAKLSHLLRIVAYLVVGLNAVPALAGLGWKDAAWWYPFLHLGAAFAAGLVMALFCCAIFGWLVRFVPPARLKAAGQIADMMPWIVVLTFQYAHVGLGQLQPGRWLPADPHVQAALAAVALLAAAASIWFGIRALSGDYLVKVATIAHSSSGAKSPLRRAPVGALVARFTGGPPARAGFEYMRRMVVRDWQFRRQLLPLLPAIIGPLVMIARDWRTSPFSGKFTSAHVLPHVIGVWLFFICLILQYGSDYKGAWIFQLPPSRNFDRFVRGVHAFLLLALVVAPNAVLLPVVCWAWGLWQGALFVAFSLAVSSIYLAGTLRMVEGLPFARQMEANRGAGFIPLMVLGGAIIAVAVAAQHFLLFRYPLAVLAVTPALAVIAIELTKSSLTAFADTIRFSLGLDSNESGSFYVEL